MNANELRIGNILYFGDPKSTIRPLYFKIEGGHSISAVSDGVDVRPIPLTEEWLLKFGFAYWTEESSVLQKVIAYSDGSYPCTLQVSGRGIQICRSGIGAICPEIEYVHQLQNLYFALTGQELKIKQ